MDIDIFNVDKFVQVNNLKEITNPITLDRGNIPTPDGLLSTEIFGRTPEDRKTIFAFISLGSWFLHPLVYKNLLRLDRRLEGIIAGTETYKVNEKGELVQDDLGDTGLLFLYKNWDKIRLKSQDSGVMRQERLNLNNVLKKNEAFMDKLIVCPAFYRDINLSKSSMGKVSVGDINKMYVNVLRLTKSLKNDSSGLPLIGNSTRNLIQKELVNIYDYFISDNIKGKNGLFRKFALGVSVDYGARLVISNNRFTQDKYDDMLVDFYHCALPLATCCVNFYPFVLKYVKDLFYNEFYLKPKKTFLNKKGEIEIIEIKNPENIISDEYISKAIDSFIHSYADRFKVIKIPTKDGRDMVISIAGYYQDAKGNNAISSTEINRPATWTDILYMACEDVVKDKHVIITRYPIIDYFNVMPNKINVASTKITKPAMINGKFYPHYPVIDPNMPTSMVSTSFIDTLNLSNLYLQGLGGGDYDGDQVSVRGVFTQEANKELDEILRSKKNILDVSGGNVRATEKEAIQAFYNLTKTTPDE